MVPTDARSKGRSQDLLGLCLARRRKAKPMSLRKKMPKRERKTTKVIQPRIVINSSFALILQNESET